MPWLQLWPVESQHPAHEGHGLAPEPLLEPLLELLVELLPELLPEPLPELPPAVPLELPLPEPEDPDALPPEPLELALTSGDADASGLGANELESFCTLELPPSAKVVGLDVPP